MVLSATSLKCSVHRPYFGSSLEFETWLTRCEVLGNLLSLTFNSLIYKIKILPLPAIWGLRQHLESRQHGAYHIVNASKLWFLLLSFDFYYLKVLKQRLICLKLCCQYNIC